LQSDYRNSDIYAYSEAIKKGYIEINGERKRLIVGAKIKKAVKKLMGYFEDPRITYDPTEWHRRREFMETLCLQGKAPFYNKPVVLMLWQKAFFEAIYSFYEKATGYRLIKKAELEVARKNGKSTMLAADVNADLFIGNGGIDIACLSNDDRQAKFIWGEVAGMRSRLDTKNEITSNTLTVIKNRLKEISIIRISAKTQQKDGFNLNKYVQDEKHDCKTGELAEAADRAQSTHEDRLAIGVSTNGFLDGMFYDKELEYANAWLNDEIDDIYYLAFLFEQDEEAECWGDIELLQKSNPSLIYGVKKYSFLEQSRKKAMIDKESRMHFLTKDCNIKCSNSSAWLMLEEYWYDMPKFTLENFRDHFCLGSVDLADCGDLAVAEALFMRKGDDTKYIVPQFFIPESKLKDKDNGAQYAEWARTINPVTGLPYVTVCKGNKIDQKHIADWFQMLRKKYNIKPVMIGYDPWHSDVFLLWCDKKTGYGFDTMKIYQNSKLMSFPMKTVERDLHAKLINYGNNPVMKYCFGNMSAKIVGDFIMPEKIDGNYARKIDGVVAMIILYATLEKNEVAFNQYLR
jgi:phage terminase large subunit-like protein